MSREEFQAMVNRDHAEAIKMDKDPEIQGQQSRVRYFESAEKVAVEKLSADIGAVAAKMFKEFIYGKITEDQIREKINERLGSHIEHLQRAAEKAVAARRSYEEDDMIGNLPEQDLNQNETDNNERLGKVRSDIESVK